VIANGLPDDQIRDDYLKLQLLRNFPATCPGAIALAADGDMWVVELPTGTHPAVIVRYGSDGKKRSVRIVSLDDPQGIAVARD
jgi:hypothetical protein